MVRFRQVMASACLIVAFACVARSQMATPTTMPATTQTSGLTISKAVWGDIAGGTTVVDVTAKVKEAVQDGKLSIQATNDNFTDVAPGIVKELKVSYTLDSKTADKSATEGETLTIP